ncbi:MAG: FAD-binding oxidoreductase, partial [Myxococcales bacterium]|nr:FAD-binding oxidoreductase [Myxococcales bacterium]
MDAEPAPPLDPPLDPPLGPPLDPAVIARFAAIVGDRNCIWRPDELRTYECDGLTSFRARPGVVVLPASRAEVVEVVRLAYAEGLPIV